MSKKYYGWIIFGLFIFILGILLIINSDFFKKSGLEILEPSSDSSYNLSEENILPVDETAIEIDMENSDADFEADMDDFESDLEDIDNFDEDMDLESIDDDELF